MPTQMPAYQPTPISSEDQTPDTPISHGMLAYFRGRLSNRIHELVLSEFAAREREGKTSRAQLARRIRRKPEQITRWLGSPGNWTLDTLSDLLLGMNLEPTISARSLASATNPSTEWQTHISTVLKNVKVPDYFVHTFGSFLIEIQTAEEVARDIHEGNHKSHYLNVSINIPKMVETPSLIMGTAPLPSLPTSLVTSAFYSGNQGMPLISVRS